MDEPTIDWLKFAEHEVALIKLDKATDALRKIALAPASMKRARYREIALDALIQIGVAS
jgi:hypothetical protein